MGTLQQDFLELGELFAKDALERTESCGGHFREESQTSSYENLKNDDAYERIITQEYAYWLILAEWDYYVVTGKKESGMTGNGEFTIGTPSEIESQLPLGHQLYKDYVEKILSIPDEQKIIALFP